ncbi:MAG: glycerol-3-phosphate 1-O-acyltransferase PlsY [Hyphomicrobiales bacterium]
MDTNAFWLVGAPLAAVMLAAGYLVGSIPFGLLLTRIAGLGDVRKIGSGNIGATNVLRTGNKGLAALTLAGDLLKGTAAVLIGSYWGPGAAAAAGLGAFLGHLYPVWLGFKGGKGVATYIGVLLGIEWRMAIAFCVIWLAVAATTRYSSLSALIASAMVPPLLYYVTGSSLAALLFAVMTALVYWRHRANIVRLMKGEESRIGR